MQHSNRNALQGGAKQPGFQSPLNQYTQQPQQANDDSPFYKSAAPSISLPKGGGALKGIDEKFSVNAVNGAAGMEIPLPLTPGRGGFSPALSLSYNSGGGNSEFGLGWGLSLPAIQRRTDRKLPLYNDRDESDVFLLAGAEDLVPELGEDGQRVISYLGDYTIKRYRPRIEGLFARIELIRKKGRPGSWWRVTSKDNITTYYGLTEEGRIADPADGRRIFKWLPQLVIDHKGNVQQYRYTAENEDLIPQSLHEKNRLNNGPAPVTNTYLKRVQYCNKTPWTVDTNDAYDPSARFPLTTGFLMEAVLDYGDHSTAYSPGPDRSWPCRTDAFSAYHAGFEIRTYRTCKRVLMFHHFSELEGNNLVRSLELTYRHDGATGALTEADLILSATQRGYEYRNGAWRSDTLPPMTFDYEPLQWHTDMKTVAARDFQGAPQGLTGPYQWTDFYGEGISGILTEQGNGWFYKSNQGDGHFTPPAAIATKPNFRGLGSQLQWQDLDADGRRQLVSEGPVRGFWPFDSAQGMPYSAQGALGAGRGEWGHFQPFAKNINIDWNSPFTRMLDLDGDGRADVLIAEDRVWTWYHNEGKKGFDTGGQTPVFTNEEKGPVLLLRDKVQSIFLADMSGDGLTDLVRINNGEVCYWPNMGYGKFGAKVAMTNAPSFHHPDVYNPQYLSLADISGTGAADLVYIGNKGRCTAWINLSGNGFSGAKEIGLLPATDQLSKIAVLDFLGNGTGCIVWSSPLPQHASAPIRYIDLMGGKKPYLMRSYYNGMGKTVSVTYKSSTQFYLADKLAGKPWATRLPFPVHCIAQVSTHDRVSDTTFTQNYRYRHGYYDHEEREFRGFGYVETIDMEKALLEGAQEPEQDRTYLNQPPVLTKTWYHTGAWLRGRSLPDAFKEEYYHFDGWDELATQAAFAPGLSPQEQCEAYRALKGSALRQEVYALDGDPVKQDIPYTVTVSSYQVNRVQQLGRNRFAAFLVYSDQQLAWSCERQPEDARLAHTLTMAVDEYGHVLEAAQIAYPRKPVTGADPSPLPLKVQQEQAKMPVVYTRNSMTGDIKEPVYYRLRVPWQVKASELTGLVLPAGTGLWTVASLRNVMGSPQLIDFADEAMDGIVQERITGHSITLFADEDNALALPLGEGILSAQAIPYEQYTLAYTAGTFAACYGEDIVAADLLGPMAPPALSNLDGGYTDLHLDGNWWVASGTVQYGANPGLRFYSPQSFTDPWGNVTEVAYWNSITGPDNYWLLPQSVTDDLGNTSRVLGYDWRNLQPTIMQDANENRSAISYDALGLPMATAIMGKGTEADYLEVLNSPAPLVPGIAGDLSVDTAAQQDFWNAHDAAAIDTAAKTLLGKATWRCIYDLDSAPVRVAMIAREQHFADNNNSKVIIRVSYTDGFGRVAMHKEQAADGPLVPGGSDVLRWTGNGKTVYNNKGNAVMQFEPYFSPTHQYDVTEAAAEVGVSPRIFYDPLGRAFRTHMPDGTYQLTVWDNWTQVVYDANDTVMLPGSAATVTSAWYDAYRNGTAEEQSAALKALAHTNTPTVLYLDSLARPFFTMQLLEAGATVHTPLQAIRSYELLDIQGNRLAVIDGLRIDVNDPGNDAPSLQYRYNLLQSPCWQHSMDGGQGRMIVDAAGQPLYHWDADGRFFSTVYDGLRRKVRQQVTVGGVTKVLERIEYGENFGANPGDDIIANMRGWVAKTYDGAGLIFVNQYNFKGEPYTTNRRFTEDRTAHPDWTNIGNIALETFEDITNPFPAPLYYATKIITDALGRPLSIKNPDGSTTTHTYDKGGRLYSVAVDNVHALDADIINTIAYDAKGQRTKVQYENGTTTTYKYDPLNFRVIRIKISRASDSKVLQDFVYWYDAVGNITLQQDAAQQSVYYANSVADPENDYTYDALYRLITVSGRELAGNNGAVTHNDNARSLKDALPFMNNAADPSNAAAMRRYTQYYAYDAVGNMLSMQHTVTGGTNNWTRHFTISNTSNRMTGSSIGSNGSGTETYSYDNRGNMTGGMNHLNAGNASMTYNAMNRLEQVIIDSNKTAYYQYDAGGQRVRKTIVNTSAGITETRKYVGGWEIYTKQVNGTDALQRETLHIADDTGRIALIDTPIIDTASTGEVQLLRYQYSNHLCTASLELDEAAAIISYEEYYPYGSTSFQSGRSAAEVSLKRYRYTGKERDEETGLNYHGARYYAPWLCRWMAVDPINSEWYNIRNGNPGRNKERSAEEIGASSYEYCYDNPINYDDSNGEQPPTEKKGIVFNAIRIPRRDYDTTFSWVFQSKTFGHNMAASATNKMSNAIEFVGNLFSSEGRNENLQRTTKFVTGTVNTLIAHNTYADQGPASVWNNFYKPVLTSPETYEDLGADLALGYLGGKGMASLGKIGVNVSIGLKGGGLNFIPTSANASKNLGFAAKLVTKDDFVNIFRKGSASSKITEYLYHYTRVC